jgi:DNA-directed RNA polymerase specialized sigma24 family protein
MRCPVGTVMSRLHRGRSRLRELLAETALVRA